MNCGCTKHLGCYPPNAIIDFGFIAISSDPYTFEIFTNGGYYEIPVSFDPGDPIVLPFTFNENSETIIKIRFPDDVISSLPLFSGVNYLTSKDGACSFSVLGTLPLCPSPL
jgi:hypothetical protein